MDYGELQTEILGWYQNWDGDWLPDYDPIPVENLKKLFQRLNTEWTKDCEFFVSNDGSPCLHFWIEPGPDLYISAVDEDFHCMDSEDPTPLEKCFDSFEGTLQRIQDFFSR